MIRTGATLASIVALAVVLGLAVSGLPAFGTFDGAYGQIVNDLVLSRDHVTQVVSGVAYDVRSFDSLGEVFILFTAVMGTALLLRESRDEDVEPARDVAAADTIRLLGLGLVPVVVVIGLVLGTTTVTSPGGGFQVGVVLAGGALLLWAAGSYRTFRAASPTDLVDLAEGVGAGGFVVTGLVGLATTGVFLQLIPGPGPFGTIHSGGSIAFVSWASALEVAAANVLIFHEFLEEHVRTAARRG